jgi:hypothetical protein
MAWSRELSRMRLRKIVGCIVLLAITLSGTLSLCIQENEPDFVRGWKRQAKYITRNDSSEDDRVWEVVTYSNNDSYKVSLARLVPSFRSSGYVVAKRREGWTEWHQNNRVIVLNKVERHSNGGLDSSLMEVATAHNSSLLWEAKLSLSKFFAPNRL